MGKSQTAPLQIIAFGAHPDDCELREGGAAAKWAAQGAKVKFVSCTNGDIGHWGTAGGALAKRRLKEVQACAKILGIATQVLDIHDGELTASMENRRTICRLIREWGADVVISHRPNDYHPDHRAVGQLIMDSGYMVTVPYFCPDVPHLVRNPVFLFSEDEFQKPNPFAADVVVAVDDVIGKKFACVEALVSQFYEGGCNGGPGLLPDPKDPRAGAKRRGEVRAHWNAWFSTTAQRFRSRLVARYGKAAGAKVTYAEAFELCEYGRRPDAKELDALFPR